MRFGGRTLRMRSVEEHMGNRKERWNTINSMGYTLLVRMLISHEESPGFIGFVNSQIIGMPLMGKLE